MGVADLQQAAGRAMTSSREVVEAQADLEAIDHGQQQLQDPLVDSLGEALGEYWLESRAQPVVVLKLSPRPECDHPGRPWARYLIEVY